MINQRYTFNIKKSRKDARDYIYMPSHIDSPARTSELDYRQQLQPIRDQGSQGSCYAQTVACVKEWQEKMDNGFGQTGLG